MVGFTSRDTVWDVPLLESPPVSLSDITSGDPLPSMETPGLDRGLALQEFTSSPIYRDLTLILLAEILLKWAEKIPCEHFSPVNRVDSTISVHARQ